MKKDAQTMQHLRKLRLLLEETIYVENIYRIHLKKTKPEGFSKLLLESVKYEDFLKELITEIFDDITL